MPPTEKHFESSLKSNLCYHEESQGLIAGRIIDVSQLKKMLAQGGVTLLDVRRKADREAAPGMIPGAIWRDPEQVEQWAGEVAQDARTVIYCARGGSVSQSVRNKLLEKGLTVVYLDGGLKAWTDHGETPRPEATGTRAGEQTTHTSGGKAMTDKKRTTTEEIEATLACSAFAEEGVPCPLCDEKEKGAVAKDASPTGKESMLDSVEDDFACTAFSDQNEECPIGSDKKE